MRAITALLFFASILCAVGAYHFAALAISPQYVEAKRELARTFAPGAEPEMREAIAHVYDELKNHDVADGLSRRLFYVSISLSWIGTICAFSANKNKRARLEKTLSQS